jgi:L-lactate dehydrogenase complex protein LldG
VPERASGEPAPALAERVARFTKLAAATQMTVARIATRSAVPAAVRDYLRDGQDVPGIVADQTLDIAAADWRRAGLEFSDGDTRPDGDTYISAGLAALAECGAVVIASGPGRALRNDFLARTHIVVVAVDRLLPTFADLWTLLRNRSAGEQLPRELCLITGPSRTADLGVPAKLGAHGPARVHVLLVDAW